MSSAVAQIIVPMASSLAAEHERGRVVGTVMSGLLIGILAARTASGILAGLLGWRVVFVIAAALMVLLAAMLRWALPQCRRPSAFPTARCFDPCSPHRARSRCCASGWRWAPP